VSVTYLLSNVARIINSVTSIYSLRYNVLSVPHVGNFRQTAASICPVLQFTRGMWLRPSGVGGRSYDWLSPDFPRCGRGTKWRRALKDVVSAEKRIGPESRRPAGQHRSVSRRVSRFHRSDAFPSGSKNGLITTRRAIINTGAELIDIGRVRITDAGRRHWKT
jgi:hypothetical protein